jgi:aldose 1-epimerase
MTRAGQLIEVSSGNRKAVITEQGATLFRVVWDGTDVLDTATEDGWAPHGCHGQLMLPWPGRVRHGHYEFEGQQYQLPIDEQRHDAAIHGWARWATWQVREHRSDRAVLGCRLFALPWYPWPLELEQTYEWGPKGLECRTVAKNLGDGTAPFGFGQHPYFTLGAPIVDSCLLQIPASQYFEPAGDLTPTLPARPVDGSPYDFRQARPVGPTEYDVTLAGLGRDADGWAVVKFRSPGGDRSITLRYDGSVSYLQLYSGDTLPSGRRHGLAIEPYTCVPDAFNNGVGLVRLAPGASTRVVWALAVG